MDRTYKSDVQTLIKFAHDQGEGIPEVMEAATRLEVAIAGSLGDCGSAGMDSKALRMVATNQMRHLYNGLCPDDVAGHDSRDPACPVCKAIGPARTEA